MEKQLKIIIGTVTVVAIIIIASVVILTGNDKESEPEKKYWTFIQGEGVLEETALGWYPGYSRSNSVPGQPDQGDYLWYKVEITITFPEQTSGSFGRLDFGLTLFPNDDHYWRPFAFNSDPDWTFQGIVTVNKDDSRTYTKTLHFCIPGNDVTYVPLDGEYILKYVGNMEVTL